MGMLVTSCHVWGHAYEYENNVETINYWTIFSMMTKWNQNWKLYWNFGGGLGVVGKPLMSQI